EQGPKRGSRADRSKASRRDQNDIAPRRLLVVHQGRIKGSFVVGHRAKSSYVRGLRGSSQATTACQNGREREAKSSSPQPCGRAQTQRALGFASPGAAVRPCFA